MIYKIFTLFFIVCYGFSARAQLYVQSSATLSTTNGAIVTLQDMDLVNNGNLALFFSNSRFVFNGVSDNSISGSMEPGFDMLEIAKTGSATLTLRHELAIQSAIVFTSGNIELNNHNISLETNAVIII